MQKTCHKSLPATFIATPLRSSLTCIFCSHPSPQFRPPWVTRVRCFSTHHFATLFLMSRQQTFKLYSIPVVFFSSLLFRFIFICHPTPDLWTQVIVVRMEGNMSQAAVSQNLERIKCGKVQQKFWTFCCRLLLLFVTLLLWMEWIWMEIPRFLPFSLGRRHKR